MQKLLALSLLVFVTACGVKPGGVEAPEGSAQTKFPRTYPDVQTDPTPYIKNQY